MAKDNVIRLRDVFDAHVHLREDNMLRRIARYTLEYCRWATVMPNLAQPIRTGQQALAYREKILELTQRILLPQPEFEHCVAFEPIMTIQITPETSVRDIIEARRLGVLAGKSYPRNVTTNSEHGIIDYNDRLPIYQAMAGEGMIMLFHGESPDKDVEGIDKEEDFYREIMPRIIDACPDGRIVGEHITTAHACDFIAMAPTNVVATITAHHLVITLDDVIGYSPESGGKGNPHLLCKPTAKRRADRYRLRRAATSGNSKFLFGSDSAPHDRVTGKECEEICCGVFTAPVLLPVLAQVFEEDRALHMLQGFVSGHGSRFYGLSDKGPTKVVTLERQPWTVEAQYGGVVPFMAKRQLDWQITDISVV